MVEMELVRGASVSLLSESAMATCTRETCIRSISPLLSLSQYSGVAEGRSVWGGGGGGAVRHPQVL